MKKPLIITSLFAVIAISYITAALQTPQVTDRLSSVGDRVNSVEQVASIKSSDNENVGEAGRTTEEKFINEQVSEEKEQSIVQKPDEIRIDFDQMSDCLFTEGTGVCAIADLNGDGFVDATDLGFYMASRSGVGEGN